MVELFDAIRAGKITEIKLISTIVIENRKTIQFTGMNFFLVTLLICLVMGQRGTETLI